MDYLKKLNIDKIRNAAEDAINQHKPKSDVEARIYEALSHKNWGSSSTLMNEIARDSFDYDKFNIITRIIWESLEHPRPAAWRVVFKALTLLEHLVKNGSERCVDDGRTHSHVLRALFNFNYYEGTVDRGQGVREKAKQVVELVGDDERVREERAKAKQLREKFGNIGGISNAGNMTGIGGGGSGYSGYGNDSASDYGGYGGSGGYGDSGIGSSGGYSDAAATSNTNTNTNSFSGRYSEEADTADDIAPTFAAIPPKKSKKKSKKSKKKKEKSFDFDESDEPAPAPAPEVDLLAMDDPAPAADDGFDAFQGAPAAPSTEAFDAFQSGPIQQQPSSPGFDAFQSAPAPNQHQSPQFDAFGTSTPAAMAPSNSQTFDAFGSNGNNMGGSMNNVNNSFANMSMGGTNGMMNMGMQQQNAMNNGMGGNVMGGSQSNMMGSSRSNIMGGGQANVMGGQVKAAPSDDDFGAFDDGKSGQNTQSDPLGGLISLDGLMKNQKNEDKTKEPIIFNDAAKAYVNNGVQHSKPLGLSKAAADMAFSGVDGLHKQTSFNANNSMNSMGNNMQFRQPAMAMNNGMNMMGGNNMNPQMGMQQQGMGGMNNMGMMGGMSNNMHMMGGHGMNSMSGMSNNMGGMSNNMMGGQQGNMMGGMMNQEQKKNMSNGMMGGNGMNQGNSTMGGQPMGGWQ